MSNGYKRTEIGLIPIDWGVELLGDFVKITSGESPSRFRFSDEGIPYFKVDQLNNSPKLADTTDYFIDTKRTVKRGSVVFPKRGASIFQNKIRIFAHDSYMDTNIMALTCHEGLASEFLFYLLSYFGLSEVADTTSVPQINNKHINPFLICLPTLNEQKAIADALSDVDGLIAGLEALIAKKRSLKTATMQQLLTGKTRLPGFGDGVGMKQTELGEIPEDWDEVALGSISTPIIGLTYKPSDVSDNGTLVLRSSNIQDENLSYDNNVHVKHELPDRVITKEGDLLICVRNGSRSLIGKCALIDSHAAGSAFGAFMSLLKSEHSQFVYFQFKSRLIKKQIEDTMGATINQITNKDLKLFCIPFPSSADERIAIATVLLDAEAEIREIENRIDKTKALKQGMMQELLTGRTRLI